jgi:hypothetical protein
MSHPSSSVPPSNNPLNKPPKRPAKGQPHLQPNPNRGPAQKIDRNHSLHGGRKPGGSPRR